MYNVSFLVFSGTNDVLILFVLGRPFCFSSAMIGYLLAVSLVVKGVGVLVGMPIMTRIFKLSDTTIACAGIITNIASTIFMAFTTKTWQPFLGKLPRMGWTCTQNCPLFELYDFCLLIKQFHLVYSMELPSLLFEL
jgi:PCFT/HCP family folate transporter-like MFS transporter 1/3